MTGRKHDQTGRSTATPRGKRVRKNIGPPDTPWQGFSAEMLGSKAWQTLSHVGRRILDGLVIENIHGRLEKNGHLKRTYDDFEEQGIARSSIRKGIDDCCKNGFLVIVSEGGRGEGGITIPSVYRLTFAGTLEQGPTNEWKTVSARLEREADTAESEDPQGRYNKGFENRTSKTSRERKAG